MIKHSYVKQTRELLSNHLTRISNGSALESLSLEGGNFNIATNSFNDVSALTLSFQNNIHLKMAIEAYGFDISQGDFVSEDNGYFYRLTIEPTETPRGFRLELSNNNKLSEILGFANDAVSDDDELMATIVTDITLLMDDLEITLTKQDNSQKFTVAIFNTNDFSIYEQHLPKHDAMTLWKANVI